MSEASQSSKRRHTVQLTEKTTLDSEVSCIHCLNDTMTVVEPPKQAGSLHHWGRSVGLITEDIPGGDHLFACISSRIASFKMGS